MTASDTYSAFMLDHAAGNLSDGLHLAADIHRLMSSEGEAAAELWETVREVMSADQGNNSQPELPRSQVESALNIIHTDYSAVKWRRGVSGVRYSNCAGRVGQLMHLKPGQHVFAHGHSALEATVVLEGELADGHGCYKPGEILLAGPGIKHKPAANGNVACTCYVARSSRPFWRFT